MPTKMNRLPWLACLWLSTASYTHALVPQESPKPTTTSRREVLQTVAGLSLLPASLPVQAEDATVDMAAITAARERKSQVVTQEAVDLAQFNQARSKTRTALGNVKGVIPMQDPPPTRSLLRCGIQGQSSILIPRVGYSYYKTKVEDVPQCTSLALRSGIRHLDLASSYESTQQVGKALQGYLNQGLDAVTKGQESVELVEKVQQAGAVADAKAAIAKGAALTPAPLGSIGRKARRESLFLSYKLSNDEQSTDPVAVRRTVKQAISQLQINYLDMVMIHSPLTDSKRRLTTYEALLELRDAGFVKSVGVCNYGLGPLQEIERADLDLPALNQLELSPFHQHTEVVDWCSKNGIVVECSAWSRLSGADGPAEGWAALSKIAQAKGMTKAQVLVQWSLQKGYLCVPRSGASSEAERLAIAENSYGGVHVSAPNLLTNDEMATLDSLNVNYKAGKLGRKDGWTDADVTSSDWDPTEFV